MKKFISITLLFVLFVGLSGCMHKTVTPNTIGEIKQVESKKDIVNRYTYKGKNYQLLGVFKNTIENDLMLKEIMVNMKKVVNNEEKTFKHTNMKYSFDEQRTVCRKKVNLGEYGYFRNVIEKEKLLIYCFDDIERKGFDQYSGTSYSSEITNDTLLINITVGEGEKFSKAWQKVKIIKYDMKIYLMAFSSKKIYKKDLMFTYTNLLNLIHDKKIITIKPPHKVDWLIFPTLL